MGWQNAHPTNYARPLNVRAIRFLTLHNRVTSKNVLTSCHVKIFFRAASQGAVQSHQYWLFVVTVSIFSRICLMRKSSYPFYLLLLTSLLATLLVFGAVNVQRVKADRDWVPLRSNIQFGISGMSFVSQENNQSQFLIVHDNKKPDETRLALISISANNPPEYQPLTWPNDSEMPIDLEAIAIVPGSNPPAFMAATSRGQIYHLTLENSQTLEIVKVFNLPKVPQNNNFEGLALQEIDGQLLIVWTHRGQDSDPGIIYWGTVDLNNYQISFQSVVELTVPWPTEDVRHISDIKIDPAGTLYITSAKDSGDDGPFSSAVYIAGVFIVNNSEFKFRVNSQLTPIYRFADHKIEGLELIPGVNGGIIFGTDDETMGSSIYTSF